MRVISGTCRGRRLLEPEGMAVRPTTDQVKEALFNIIQFDVEGRRVLDLFLAMLQTWNNKQYAPGVFDDDRRAPGQKENSGDFRKTSSFVFPEIPAVFPCALAHRPAGKAGLPGSGMFSFSLLLRSIA